MPELVDANSQMQSLGIKPFPGMLGSRPRIATAHRMTNTSFAGLGTPVPEFVSEAL